MLNPYKGGKFRVTSIYGTRTLNGVRQHHPGLDLVGESSKELLALCDGTIIQSRMVPKSSGDLTWQWGNYVCLQATTGERIFYCHLSKRLVVQGQKVKKGDVIGIEGNTGYSFGSHCHLEIRNSNNRVTSAVNTPKFTDIPNQIGTYSAIVIKEEDEPMTAAEKEKFEALQNQVKALASKTQELEKELDKTNKIYKYWKDLPEWAYAPLIAMYKAGYFAGASPNNLNLSQTKMECLVVLARALKKDGKLNF